MLMISSFFLALLSISPVVWGVDLGLPLNPANDGTALGKSIENTAIGADSSAIGGDSTAIGSGSTASGEGGTASGIDSTASGIDSTASSDYSTANGANTLVNEVGGTAVGHNSSVAGGATGSVALGQNSVADEANTVSVGSASNQRRITNVADGVNANDAVTVQQLQNFSLSSSADIGRLDNRIDDIDKRLDKVGALSMAIAQLSPNPRAQGDTSLSLGIGHYSGSSALAAGLFHHVNDNLMLKASVTSGSGETGGGVTISW